MLQHVVYLSLGSNLGNKKYNLQLAIDLIHQWVATVVATSGIYESEAWGFDGESFYNCNIKIHTLLSSTQLYKKLQKIEQQMGRTPQKTDSYENRIIDIDILFFNQEIIKNNLLTIPHPRIHERNFVLLPLLEIENNFIHPQFNISIKELIKSCNDHINCKLIEASNYKLQFNNQYNYIAIEGNIGIGKTTLASKIAEDFKAKLILERFADNPFLPKFYNDISRYAFPLEVSFLTDRYQQINEDLTPIDLNTDFVIADYHIFKSIVFSQITLEKEELNLYRKLFDIIYKDTPQPNLFIYLHQNIDILLKNIEQRGRDYEKKIDEGYLKKISEGYLNFIQKQPNLNVHLIDISDKDYVNKQEDYLWVINQINSIIKR
ncbi:MAG: 2-amino-4-hydroxy-6-hydroxymethyldihydropteridine diphosphokinase [Flavobacterium sp.]